MAFKAVKWIYRILKFLITIFFIVLAIFWILYTLNHLNVTSEPWNWAKEHLSFVATPMDNFLMSHIKPQEDSQGFGLTLDHIGITMFLTGFSVLFIYVGLMFPIGKIPVLGRVIKFASAIIPILASLTVIIGGVLIWAI